MIETISSAYADTVDSMARTRRERIRLSQTDLVLSGNVYYVSADGNDEADGTTPQTAWRSVAHVNQYPLLPGDAVLFRRGDQFRGGLMAYGGVTYSAYGEGRKPTLIASPFDGAKVGRWIMTEIPYIYRYSEPMDQDIGCLVLNHGQSHGIKALPDHSLAVNLTTGEAFHSWKDLSADLHFYHDLGGTNVERNDHGGVLYFRSDKGNPAERFDSIEFNIRSHGITVRGDHVRINNLCIKYCGCHGIAAYAACVSGLCVEWCELEWIGGSLQCYFADGHPVRYGNGVEIYGCLKDYTIENCYVNQVYDAGITHQQSSDGTQDITMDCVLYKGNLIENCTYSIEYFMGKAENDARRNMSHIRIQDNILRFAGYGWGDQRPDREEAAHIKSWDHWNPGENQCFSGNILDRSRYMMAHIVANEPQWLPYLRENLWIQHRDGLLGRIGLRPSVVRPYTEEEIAVQEILRNDRFFFAAQSE